MTDQTVKTNGMIEAVFAESGSLGAPGNIANSKWVVMKFGGTSVSTADKWKNIADRIRNRVEAGFRLVVVHSALTGVSNALEEILVSAISGETSEHFPVLKQQH